MTKLKILPKKARFKYLTIEDILAMPDPKWVIQDFITETSLGQLFGPSDIGKSFVVLDMALCVATGTKWLGTHSVVQGPVIYVAAEGSRGMKKRIPAWLEHHGLEPADLMENFRLIGEALPLGNPGDVRTLIRDCKEEVFPDRDLVLIVLDTQARCTVGLNEDKATEMGLAIDAADRIKNTTGAAVLLLHHIGLQEGRGRGSTGVYGALDAQASLTGSNHKLILTCTKTKDDEKFKPIPIQLIKVAKSLVPVSRAPMSAAHYIKKA